MFLLCKHVRLTCVFNKLMMMMMMIVRRSHFERPRPCLSLHDILRVKFA